MAISYQLTKVTENGSSLIKSEGFKDVNNAIDYTYDVNGNMTKDLNKGITDISYNHLNLPTKIHFRNGGSIDYKYDARGVKLEKEARGEYGDPSSTQYAGNYIYKKNPGRGAQLKLAFFNHPEGYVSPKNASDISQGFKYVYQYKDHLGNVRLSYTDNNNDGVITPSTEIIEESNYYPFGLKHKGYNNVVNSLGNSTAQKFGYNGKELNEELGIQWHDFGARNYDASLGRWFVNDKLADDVMQVDKSPYSYSWNSPLALNDPDGNCPWCWGAVIGAATEYLGQVAVNFSNGDSVGDALWNNIDGADVLVSAGEGALTGGTSALKRIGITVAGEVVKASVDVNGSGDVDVIGTESSNKTVKGAVIDVVTGTVGAEGANKINTKLAKMSSEKAVKTAKSKVLSASKNLDKANNVVKNGAKNSKAKTTSQAFKDFKKVKQAQDRTKILNKTVGRNLKATETAVGTAETFISTGVNEEIKKRIDEK
ncbi:RHS repeat-associated core domain-containing protein [Tenacibaculum maritimum]|uniref:RHS repeat-associated core domain-containing protein n=1 Tax=Tenacibaculum maritimum TaxID=107401 RepID=UPI001330CE1D|nr:RHS repeat-associated core domain-containing protein [Tenacibaculum maritimum]